MQELVSSMRELISPERATMVLLALLILTAGFSVAAILPRRLPVAALHPQQQLLVRRTVKYALVALTITMALRVLGVSLGFLLGTAGILTVAVGFAAQTSASNLISGLFLMAERPFVIGDVIQVGSTTGEVVSIDLLSVRLRTFDNLQVRIPNETMLKSEVKTLTHYPIRRLDMKLGVAYSADLQQVEAALARVAEANPICLEEPKPLLIVLGFGESAVDLQYSVWSTKESFLELRNSMYLGVKAEFERTGIGIPYPHRVLVSAPEPRAAEPKQR